MVSVTAERPRPGRRDAVGPFTEAVHALQDAAFQRAIEGPGLHILTPLLRGRWALRAHTVDLAADALARDTVHTLLTHGWTPTELVAFARRRLDADAMSYLLDSIAAAAQVTVAPPWYADLSELGISVWWSVSRPHLAQWAVRHARKRADTVQTAVEVLALLCHVPRTEHPLPGSPRPLDLEPGAIVHDRRIAGKIDALLRRAGDTDFPEEARSCIAKAQALMVRYATVPDVAPDGPVAAAAAAAMEQLVREGPLVVAKTLFAGVRFGTSLGLSFVSNPAKFTGSVGEEVGHFVRRIAAALSPKAITAAPDTRRPRPLPAGKG
ncbi:MAG: DUF2786 domain-containing protein [Jatrophihabitans sp.]|uniref:DUF2786 domain-containing protein n=1 Tax=Jatrophihabitans sp. TaxID=1932789 RepID=UPI003F7E9FBD